MRIIFTDIGGSPSIMTAADCGLTVDQIAQKDVPRNMPYWKVEEDTAQAFLEASDLESFIAGLGTPHGYGNKSK